MLIVVRGCLERECLSKKEFQKLGRKIKTFDVDEMIGLGTYEDYIDFANK